MGARFLLLLFLFAGLVRGAYAWRLRDLPTQHSLVMDARHYDEQARRIVAEGWMPREVFYQAPLYPYVLAAVYAVTGGSRAAVRLLQVLLGAATAVVLAVATARLFGDAAGRIAGAVAALYGPFVFSTPLLLKTTFTLFAEAAFLLLLIPRPGAERPGPRRLLAAGVCLGVGVLLQENLLLLLPCAGLFLLLPGPEGERWGARLRAGLPGLAACAAGAALALAPVTLLNYRTGGELVLTSSQGGVNFYIGNARGASGTYSGLGAGSQDPEQQKADARTLAAALAGPAAAENLTPGRISAIFWRESRRQIRAAPLAWGRLLLWKTRLFWNAGEIPDAEGYRVYRRAAGAVAWPWLGFGLIAPCGLLGLALAWRSRPAPWGRPGALLLALLAAGVWISVVLFFVFGRYRLAVVPFLIPPAAWAVVAVAGLARRRETRRLAFAVAGLGLAVLAIDLPAYPAAAARGQDAAVWFNLGSAAIRWAAEEDAAFRARAGGGPEAVAHLARAVELAGEAADDLAQAVAANPGFFVARIERAVALHRRGAYLAGGGAFAPAVAAYDEARRELVPALASGDGGALPEARRQAGGLLAALAADTATALNNLGAKKIEAGDLDGAEAALRRATGLAPRAGDRAGAWGNLGLCLLQKGLRARREGRAAEAAGLLAAGHDAFTRALDALALDGPAASPQEAAFLRHGLELTSE